MLHSENSHEFHPHRRDIPKIRASQRSKQLSPSELFVWSFAALILVGTIGFKILPGLHTGSRLTFVDALFTTTSAVCVTGLITEDTATFFTFWGQFYVLILIQLGGLGMLTFASFIIAALGGRLSLRAQSAIGATPETLTHFPMKQMLVDIVKFTFICELVGAIALYLIWGPRLGWQEAIWPAIFHSVSAFCNAGFSTNTNSLIPFADSPATLLVISALIISGGIGFVTMEELYRYFYVRDHRIRRISVHTKMVLASSLILLILPVAGFAVFEWNRTFALPLPDGSTMSVIDKLANAFFLSVTPRTAGFNSIDYGLASDSTNLLTMMLMMVGGAPGSTAGGMKITTFTLMLLLAWTKLRGRPFVAFGDRSIPEKTVHHATGIFMIMISMTLVGIFLLQLCDDPFSRKSGALFVEKEEVRLDSDAGNSNNAGKPLAGSQFLHRSFEVVSALNTVGLSMGITASLSVSAKLILVVIMFVGRIGPLALFAAFETRFADRCDFRMAKEDVIVG